MMTTNPITILHIDPEFKVNYFIIRKGASIRSSLSLEQTVELLESQEIDLILSEPHSQVILKPLDHSEETKTVRTN
jgi:hypothetical protein